MRENEAENVSTSQELFHYSVSVEQPQDLTLEMSWILFKEKTLEAATGENIYPR